MKKVIVVTAFLVVLAFVSGCKFDMPPEKYTGTWEGTYRLSNWLPDEGDATVKVTENAPSNIDISFNCVHDTIVIHNCTMERYSGGIYGSTVFIYNNSQAYEEASMYVNLDQQYMSFYYDSAAVSFNFSASR